MIGIFGSNGFVGRHLVRRLSADGVALRAVSRRHDDAFIASIHGQVEFVQADITDKLAMVSSLQDITTVVQLVSTSSPGLKNDHMCTDIRENVLPHVGFLRNCVNAGVERYIFLSSGGTVYGPGAAVPTPESEATNPICSQGLTKLFVEKYIQMHGHVEGLDYVILRLANAFGPGQEFRKGQGLVPAIISRYRKGLPVRIFGDGLARRDYVYIDDVVEAILAAIDSHAASRQILNIGSGLSRSVNEVVDTIESVTGIHFPREHVEPRRTDVDVSQLDITKAMQLLKWSPRTSFRDGLQRTVHRAERTAD